MLNFRPSAADGFSLIELMITLAVLGMLIMIALPNMGTWIQNTQIRTAAEGMQAGLQLARAEALKRNTTVRFQLVDTLTSACAVSATGRNWVVSLGDASGAVRCGRLGDGGAANHPEALERGRFAERGRHGDRRQSVLVQRPRARGPPPTALAVNRDQHHQSR